MEQPRNDSPARAVADRLASCQDYQELIPDYLAGRLAPARALLLEDHSRECIACRRALKQGREGRREAPARSAAPLRRAQPRPWWMAAAAGVAATLGAAWLFTFTDFLGHNDAIAEVVSVEGQLFRMEGEVARPLTVGQSIAEGEEVRTGKDAGAVVRLGDGSKVEMRERSALTVSDRHQETTIRVSRGDIIVEAAKQHGHLYVATDDCLVAVKGTIFSVAHGIKGSRVAVIEGEVHVEHGKSEEVLHPGDQTATKDAHRAGSIEQEIAWSRNSERYRQLLSEFKTLDREVSRALSSELRYDSRLLDLAPPETAIYLGLPNISTELMDAYAIFEARLAANEALAQWWREQVGANGADRKLRDLLERVAALGTHLGEEIVVTVSLNDQGSPEAPLFLAEVANPAGFAAVLASEVERLNAASSSGAHLRIISDPATAAAGDGSELLLWHAGDLFAATPSLAELQALAVRLAAPGSNPFVASDFHRRLEESYSQGAEWLGGVDLGRLIHYERSADGTLAFAGLGNVEHVIVERKTQGETSHTGAVLHFDGARTGAASWLAAPAAMGALDFVSADANFAAAFVVEEPARIVEQIFGFVESTDASFRSELERLEREHGISILDDLARPLGGEMAVALDGPALPSPAWKVVAEVYDAARLEQTIEWAVTEVGRRLAAAGKPAPVLTSETVNGRTYYRIAVAGFPLEANYTFAGGYLVAAPSRALVDRALAVQASGYGLTDAPGFKALLPEDGYLNFSGLVWTSLGTVANQFLAMVQSNVPADERQALSELDLGTPSLTVAYGETDRIRIVANGQGGLLGSRLSSLLGLGAIMGSHHGPHPGEANQ